MCGGEGCGWGGRSSGIDGGKHINPAIMYVCTIIIIIIVTAFWC